MTKKPKTGQSALNAYVPDQTDMEILKLLQQNARFTVKEIADKVHLSTTPVHERIKRLEKSGIIKQYTVILNPAKVKKGLMVICYVSLKQHTKTAGEKFIKAIEAMPEVASCYNISGQFDFLLKVMVENMDGYYNFHVNKLSQVDNIAQIQSNFVMGVIKDSTQLI